WQKTRDTPSGSSEHKKTYKHCEQSTPWRLPVKDGHVQVVRHGASLRGAGCILGVTTKSTCCVQWEGYDSSWFSQSPNAAVERRRRRTNGSISSLRATPRCATCWVARVPAARR